MLPTGGLNLIPGEVQRSQIHSRALLHPRRRVTNRKTAFLFTQPFRTTGLLTKSQDCTGWWISRETALVKCPDTLCPQFVSSWTSTQWTFLTFQNWAQMSHFQKGLLFLTIQPKADFRSSVSLLLILTAVLISIVLFALPEHKKIPRDKQGLHFSSVVISSLPATQVLDESKDRRPRLVSTTELLPS